MSKMDFESYQALVLIQEQIGPVKRELKSLRKDIQRLINSKEEARNALVDVISAVNRKESSARIKALAVRGFRRSE